MTCARVLSNHVDVDQPLGCSTHAPRGSAVARPAMRVAEKRRRRSAQAATAGQNFCECDDALTRLNQEFRRHCKATKITPNGRLISPPRPYRFGHIITSPSCACPQRTRGFNPTHRESTDGSGQSQYDVEIGQRGCHRGGMIWWAYVQRRLGHDAVSEAQQRREARSVGSWSTNGTQKYPRNPV